MTLKQAEPFLFIELVRIFPQIIIIRSQTKVPAKHFFQQFLLTAVAVTRNWDQPKKPNVWLIFDYSEFGIKTLGTLS